MSSIDLVVPDLGNFDEVSIVDVLVKPGDKIEVDTPLITLETDKASMDVPSTAAGTISEVLVKRGAKVGKGTVIARLSVEEANGAGAQPDAGAASATSQSSAGAQAAGDAQVGNAQSAASAKSATQSAGSQEATGSAAQSSRGSTSVGGVRGQQTAGADGSSGAQGGAPVQAQSTASGATAAGQGAAGQGAREGAGDTVRMPAPNVSAGARGEERADRSTQLLVLGAGVGGYTAAFRAADLGLKVTLVERWASLGGVCLNVGCIPSKALLHAAKVIEEAEAMSAHGISFGKPSIDLAKLRDWKVSVIKKLTNGLRMLAKQRKVDVVQGVAKFVSPHVLEVALEGGKTERIRFDQCIIAAGSEAMRLPNWPTDPRIIDSTGALELPASNGRLLIVGGGIIGLELACVYDSLGTKVSVVELTPQLMPGCDPDLVKPLEKRIRARYEQILLNTKVTGVEPAKGGLKVTFEGAKAPAPQVYDRVLVAVGRTPNGKLIGAEAAGVNVTDRGYIPVDKQMRTNVPHIFAIGDIVGQPMLAHKASHEGKVAAEAAAGHKVAFDARVIPSVAYTDPEVAWAGLTETEAAAKKVPYKKGLFPWVASGRSLSLGRDDGFTKLLFDPETHRLLGAGIVGPQAGDLISEVALAIEMGADAADIGLTIHPHPTLSETVAFAAEAFEGTLTDLYIPKK
jgi:dihydrolipoamide dehydrogenase